MEQKTGKLEGKKKFTAELLGLATALVGILVTSGVLTEESADLITQILIIVVPIGGATLYGLIQGSHDKKKEEKAIETIKRDEAYWQAQAIKSETKAPPIINEVAIQPEPDIPLDFNVLEEQAKKFAAEQGDINPITRFYGAKKAGNGGVIA